MNYKLWLPLAMLAVGFSGNTPATPAKAGDNTIAGAPKVVCIYLLYDGIGIEKDLTSYTQQLTAPEPCGGHDIICFWRICDDDGTITPLEFEAAFEAADLIGSGDDLLSDEEEIPGELEKYTLSR